MYQITYAAHPCPITREVKADSGYTACMIVGRDTQTKELRIIKVVELRDPVVLYVTT